MFLMFLTCATVSMRCCLHTDHIPRSLWECLERVVVPFISSRRKLCCAPDHLGLPGVLSKDGAIQCHRLVVCMLMVFDSCKHDALVASDSWWGQGEFVPTIWSPATVTGSPFSGGGMLIKRNERSLRARDNPPAPFHELKWKRHSCGTTRVPREGKVEGRCWRGLASEDAS